MYRLRVQRPHDVQTVLEDNLLVWRHAIEQRNCGANGLKIQIAGRILKLLQKCPYRRFVYMRLAGLCRAALDFLIVG